MWYQVSVILHWRYFSACLLYTSGITDNINFKSEQSKRDAAKLRFTERQTTAILEMRLQKLIGLELEALLKDHDETCLLYTSR